MSETPTVLFDDVHKKYGRTTALDGLSLRIEQGQVHGFLGPNGAGKSTAIRVLLGLLRADSGTVRLLGGDAWADAPRLHRRVSYVPGDVALWPNLTGGESIDLIGRARGGLDPQRRDDLIQAFELDPRKRGRSYSKGNRQKVALVAALAGTTDLILLDEPTSGLDPLMERVFTDELRRARDQGRTVLLSSHILSEVDVVCDHVSIVKAGRIVESGELAAMRHLRRTQVQAELAGEVPAELTALPGLYDVSVSRNLLTAQVESESMPRLLEALARNGVRSLVSTPPTLEDLFLRHYETGRA